MTDPPQPRPRSRVLGRVWADLPLRVKGLVVVAIPLLALLLAAALFGVALAQDRRAQGAVLHTVEVERQIAQVRILVQAGVTGYVLTGERRYLTSYEAARQEPPRSIAHLGELVSDNPGQVDRLAKVEADADRLAGGLALLPTSQAATPWARWPTAWNGPRCCSASVSRPCARPRPCWSTSSPGAPW